MSKFAPFMKYNSDWRAVSAIVMVFAFAGLAKLVSMMMGIENKYMPLVSVTTYVARHRDRHNGDFRGFCSSLNLLTNSIEDDHRIESCRFACCARGRGLAEVRNSFTHALWMCSTFGR